MQENSSSITANENETMEIFWESNLAVSIKKFLKDFFFGNTS
jgi:hypothetical protein